MKKIIFLASLVISILIIHSLIRSIYSLWNKEDLLIRAGKELSNKKKENEELKKDLNKVQSPEFIEKEARNKLMLVKEGEQRVIIPSEMMASHSSRNEALTKTPNWKKWWDLFFKS